MCSPQGPRAERPAADLGRGIEPVEVRLTASAKARAAGVGTTFRPTRTKGALAEPRLQRGDLPADGPVGQPELGRRCGVAAGTGGDLEDAQSVKGRKATHRIPGRHP